MMLGAMQDWPLRLTRLFDHAEREHGTRELVGLQADGAVVRSSWGEVVRDGRRLAEAFRRMGIAPGDRVATLATNHLRHLTAWIGAIGMGGVIHTINPRLFDDQLVYIANHAGDRILIHDAAFAPIVERIRSRLTTIERFICFEDGFDALVAGGADEGWTEGDERAPAMLCYTSGTTGKPKGVLYEHRSQMLHTFVEVTPDVFALSARSTVLPIVPMFHAGAWGLPFAAAMTGAKIVLSMTNDAAALHRLMLDERVTHSCGVPTVWLALIEHVERTGGDFGRLEMVNCGGSAAPRAVIAALLERGIRFSHLWGMTEMSPVGTAAAMPAQWDEMDREAQLDLLQKQGRAAFGIELRIVDDMGETLPRDGERDGGLQARGAWVVERYFQDAAGPATDAEGWFDTGDVARIHPDGTVQLTDRAKDVIKSGGEWISSVELENVAVGCPCVAEAAAIGVRHPKWDERPLLLCVPKAGIEPSAERVMEVLRKRVAKWWLPDEILFVDSLPHTGTGKLLKTALREQYRDHRFPDAGA